MDTIKDWYAQEFVPWREAMARYRDGQRQSTEKFAENMNELQALVALLLDGRSKQALLMWNTLGLPPTLAALELDPAREVLLLTTKGGNSIRLKVDDVLADLQALLESKTAG